MVEGSLPPITQIGLQEQDSQINPGTQAGEVVDQTLLRDVLANDASVGNLGQGLAELSHLSNQIAEQPNEGKQPSPEEIRLSQLSHSRENPIYGLARYTVFSSDHVEELAHLFDYMRGNSKAARSKSY